MRDEIAEALAARIAYYTLASSHNARSEEHARFVARGMANDIEAALRATAEAAADAKFGNITAWLDDEPTVDLMDHALAAGIKALRGDDAKRSAIGRLQRENERVRDLLVGAWFMGRERCVDPDRLEYMTISEGSYKCALQAADALLAEEEERK